MAVRPEFMGKIAGVCQRILWRKFTFLSILLSGLGNSRRSDREHH